MEIKLLVEGGAMQPGPALSQKLGPAGINLGKVIQEVNDATNGFKGMKVPVLLDIDMGTKEFEVTVSSPPASELIKKELGIEKGSAEQGKMQAANASIEQIISIAKAKIDGMLAKDLKAAVKSIVGTCTSLGILVESKLAFEIGQEIDAGKYDKEINEEKSETSPEKLKKLEKEFSEIHTKQEQAKKDEEEAAAAEEAAKAAEAAAVPEEGAAAPAEGEEEGAETEAPAEGEESSESKPAEEPAEKK
jgi:large subunit ribosomal protein L11